jgi:hypothetical protein
MDILRDCDLSIQYEIVRQIAMAGRGTHLAEKGYFNSNAEICFTDLEFIPSTVKNDGI